MVIELNLKNVPIKHQVLLIDFLKDQINQGIQYWPAGSVYHLQDELSIRFSHNIIARKRKNGKGYHFEEVSNKHALAEGEFGRVYKIKGRLVINSQELTYKKTKKDGSSRIVKWMTEQYSTCDEVMKEYFITARAGHLGIKFPVISHDKIFLVMNKASGQNLGTVLDDYIFQLTDSQKLKLTELLLLALADINQKGIFHSDIKPENIMVDLQIPNPSQPDQYTFKVTLIDFGLSYLEQNLQLDSIIGGTPAFVAPELFSNEQIATAKADIYSMARVIALLWGVSFDDYMGLRFYYASRISMSKSTLLSIQLKDLFSNTDRSFPIKHQRVIRQLLEGMLESNPGARLTIAEAIELFKLTSDIESIKERVIEQKNLLLSEIDHSFFAFRKDEKVRGLDELHQFLQNKTSFSGLFDKVKEIIEKYPDLTKGKNSRTNALLNDILKMSQVNEPEVSTPSTLSWGAV